MHPSLKHAGHDPALMVNYLPISNLSYLSKRVVCSQITSYFESNSILPPHQSGFRRFYGSIMHLLRDMSDQSQVTLLAPFDVSAAFDIVDHSILRYLETFLAPRDSRLVGYSTSIGLIQISKIDFSALCQSFPDFTFSHSSNNSAQKRCFR